jgi:hypothetical protein
LDSRVEAIPALDLVRLASYRITELTPPEVLRAFAERLDEIVLADDFNEHFYVTPRLFGQLILLGMVIPRVRRQEEVHSRLADRLITLSSQSHGYLQLLLYLNFSFLRSRQILTLIRLIDESTATNEEISIRERAIAATRLPLQEQAALALERRATDEIEANREEINRLIDEKTAELRAEIARLWAQIPPAAALLDSVPRPGADPFAVRPVPCDRRCEKIIARYWRNCAASAFPRWESDRLVSVLRGGADLIWSSDPKFTGYPSITVRLPGGHSAVVESYSLRSSRCGRVRSPYLRSWEVWGKAGGDWVCLDRQEATDVLSDGSWHRFEIVCDGSLSIQAIRVCQAGRNGCGSCQMHIAGFDICGRVYGEAAVVRGRADGTPSGSVVLLRAVTPAFP